MSLTDPSRFREGVVYRSVGGMLLVKTSAGMVSCSIRRAIKGSIYVGDRVQIDSELHTVEKLFPRKSLLYRPVVANADYVLLVFSAKEPTPSFLLLDRMLVSAEEKEISPLICINKSDLADVDLRRYEKSGYETMKVSVETGFGMEALRARLKDKVTVLAGPSGVGKSSLASAMIGAPLRISHVSKAANRGRHTTRHSEFFELPFGGVLVDSPGFGAMDLSHIGRENLKRYFPEFHLAEGCRFTDCIHAGEPGCAVTEAVRRGEIPEERYQSYIRMLEDVK